MSVAGNRRGRLSAKRWKSVRCSSRVQPAFMLPIPFTNTSLFHHERSAISLCQSLRSSLIASPSESSAVHWVLAYCYRDSAWLSVMYWCICCHSLQGSSVASPSETSAVHWVLACCYRDSAWLSVMYWCICCHWHFSSVCIAVWYIVLLLRGDHQTAKHGNVREFESSPRKVMQNGKSYGEIRGNVFLPVVCHCAQCDGIQDTHQWRLTKVENAPDRLSEFLEKLGNLMQTWTWPLCTCDLYLSDLFLWWLQILGNPRYALENLHIGMCLWLTNVFAFPTCRFWQWTTDTNFKDKMCRPVYYVRKPLGNFTQYITFILYYLSCLQCFDAVGWAAGRASSL